MKNFTLLFLLCAFSTTIRADSATELWARGYAVIPTPQSVRLENGDIQIDDRWIIAPSGIDAQEISVRTLHRDLVDWHRLNLKTGAQDEYAIRLSIRPGVTKSGPDPEIDKQAYRLNIGERSVDITGNAAAGLFYGVQTLLQLLRRDSSGALLLPKGTIEDWPKLQLRFLHWDTKHHQDRIETLKRYLDWSARFKANMIGFELEDKFEYPSHPVIGAPGAFTTHELQEIVDYGLERHIQVVPQIQAPAHMSYVLKHPEFADLRSDGSNYDSCTCDPRTLDLIFSMYDDAIAATRGVDYFVVSTDEVYYAGRCGKCSRPYNPVNRSLAFVDFVQKAHEHLTRRGRKIMLWLEFPLLPEHIKLLPSGLIDGEGTFPQQEVERGIRQLGYMSMQGAELLFPDHISHDGQKGHLEQAFDIASSPKLWQGNPIGTFGAGWDDSGLHNETFWLGWSAAARYGWNPRTPSVDQHIAEFMRVYYGPRATGMADIYRMMQRQARAWERTWDRIPSKVILTRYGGYFGKGISTHRVDMTLSLPFINDLPDWFPDPFWSDRYKEWLAEARLRAAENDQLIAALETQMGLVDRNHYNLEVLFSLARFMGHHWRLFLDIARAEEQIKQGQGLALEDQVTQAVTVLSAAYDTIDQLRADGQKTFEEVQRTFEKSRYPKGRSVGTRRFVHVFDDVKDHFADRRADLSYMLAPEDSLGFDEWLKDLARSIELYAKENNVSVQPRK
jgi:hexosaminidase